MSAMLTGESEAAEIGSSILGEAPLAEETDRGVGMVPLTRVVILFAVDGVHNVEVSNKEAEMAPRNGGWDDTTA